MLGGVPSTGLCLCGLTACVDLGADDDDDIM